MYQVKLTNNSSSKLSTTYKISTVTLYRDQANELLILISDQFHNNLILSVNYKFKLLSAKEGPGFSFGVRNLNSFIKFIPLVKAAHSKDNLKESLSGISKDPKAATTLPLYTGALKAKQTPKRSSLGMAPAMIVKRNTVDLIDEVAKVSRFGTESLKAPSLLQNKTFKPFRGYSQKIGSPLANYSKKTPMMNAGIATFYQNQASDKFQTGNGHTSLHSPPAALAKKQKVPGNIVAAPYKQQNRERDIDGLRNLGQTCYMSACVQLLFNSKLRGAVLNVRDEVRLFEGDESVFETFASLFEMKEKKQQINLKQLRSRIIQKVNKFADYAQEDAHEFLIACLGQLCLDNIESENAENLTEAESDEFNQRMQGIDPVFNTLRFQIEHCLKCQSADCYSSRNEEIFCDLSLPLPNIHTNSNVDVLQLIRSFLAPESVDFQCEKCLSKKASIHHSIKVLPLTVLLHLKRFEVGEYNVIKRHDAVEVPITLSFTEFLAPGVIGIIWHTGSGLKSGHYEYICRNPKSGLWTRYNDSVVTRDLKDLHLKRKDQSYILLYEISC